MVVTCEGQLLESGDTTDHTEADLRRQFPTGFQSKTVFGVAAVILISLAVALGVAWRLGAPTGTGVQSKDFTELTSAMKPNGGSAVMAAAFTLKLRSGWEKAVVENGGFQSALTEVFANQLKVSASTVLFNLDIEGGDKVVVTYAIETSSTAEARKLKDTIQTTLFMTNMHHGMNAMKDEFPSFYVDGFKNSVKVYQEVASRRRRRKMYEH
eukprot:TRINITY_DN27319_c0_g1_i1.p1 TRINITY_DN27319_c0_g1~~TRINITY_DN27319_c0_g1_i1.p1  ORF type:complete len:231 (+),score=38.84 TRINITY_DN27319_c0_g1_i1:63-695(+)